MLDLTPTLAFSDDDAIKVFFIGGGMLIALICILCSFARSILIGRAREQSRREIAAYVAEGSMTPDDGAKLLNAGRPAWEQGKGAWGGMCGNRDGVC